MAIGPTESQEVSWLQADDSKVKDDYVAVFVPSRTGGGGEIEHELWRNKTVQIMSQLFGGATSFRGYGGWLSSAAEPQVKEEDISVVCSFLKKAEWDEENATKLRGFLFQMGRETKQDAIGLVAHGTYLEIPRERYEQE